MTSPYRLLLDLPRDVRYSNVEAAVLTLGVALALLVMTSVMVCGALALVAWFLGEP